MSESEPQATVSWINYIPLNRRERIARWWQEDVRQGSTYQSRRNREQEFMTHIPVSQIGAVACQELRQALIKQREGVENESSWHLLPRATPDGTVYLGGISIPRKPLGVQFTAEGVIDVLNEDH